MQTPPPSPLSSRKKEKDFFLNFNIKSCWAVCTACSESLQHTSNMETQLFPVFKLLLSSFFLSCIVLISLFFFFFYHLKKLPVLLVLFLLAWLHSFTGRLPPSSPCSSSLLPRVCPARQTQRHSNIRVISIHEYISINEGDARRTRHRHRNCS